jgi:hypothetical protein
MTRLFGLLLALLLSVTPTVDVACRAVCTPQLMGAAAESCHEVASPNVDGVLLPALACQRDAVAAVAPADGARTVLAPAPLVTAQATAFAFVPASAGADLRPQAVRPRLPHAYPSTVVLRI